MTELPRDAQTRAVLRHVLATLAYRAAKVLHGTPEGFARFSSHANARIPMQIVAHMGDLMAWGLRMAEGKYEWRALGGDDWDTEVARFFDSLAAFDRFLESDAPLGHPAQMLIQGPIADALTHVGQLAMLRGFAGAPVRPESYARAEITTGRVGRDQPAPKREFDGDASARRSS